MYSYKCVVSYEGTRYNGWQKQGNTANTLQHKIEEILSKHLDESIEIVGSGRTDAGVHALGQVFHFHCKQMLIPNNDPSSFLTAINNHLPQDIRIVSIEYCHPRFHARLNAVKKTYRYQIDISTYGNLFLRNVSHHVPTPLDIGAMKKGADLLLGTHDFKSFCSNKRMKKSSVRTIYDIVIEENASENLLTLTFTGNGFLYNMVRILSGTLIEIGLGLRNPEEIPAMLEGGNRGLTGHTAPAKGLFLMNVEYD
ncbi:MAG: tRNA pseudouridine(38-40) synthase TruA [Lachnospiraceae bacterium]|nr:tRNA pseudouridine(38-40) synthase TruA [Lachnospiraceae bacterium]